MSKSNHKDKMVSKSASRGVWGGLFLSFKLKAKGPLGCFSRWAEARMSCFQDIRERSDQQSWLLSDCEAKLRCAERERGVPQSGMPSDVTRHAERERREVCSEAAYRALRRGAL